MQEAKVKVIKFESDDVIATSVTPELPGLYYFYGIGNDVLAPNGNGLYVSFNGEDVTSDYRGEYAFFGQGDGRINIGGTEAAQSGMTAAQLEERGFVDGPYELHSSTEGSKPPHEVYEFTYKQ